MESFKQPVPDAARLSCRPAHRSKDVATILAHSLPPFAKFRRVSSGHCARWPVRPPLWRLWTWWRPR